MIAEPIPSLFALALAGDFEIHLTAALCDDADLNRWRAFCEAQQIKCVYIVLDRGAHVSQPMTSARLHGTLLQTWSAAKQAVELLEYAQFDVTRVKIEAAPHCQGIPQSDADVLVWPATCYFEHHAKLLLPMGEVPAALRALCELYGAHQSRNAFKQREDGWQERFATLRLHGVGWLAAREAFQTFDRALLSGGWQLLKSESEYCVYDSRVELDAGWLL